MLTLTARQCPQCALRFGSSSELEQHLRLDHPPKATKPQPGQSSGVAQPPADSDDRTPAEPPTDAQRFVVRAIVVGALLAFVAVISWHAAALVSVVLAAIVAARASEKAAEQDRENTP